MMLRTADTSMLAICVVDLPVPKQLEDLPRPVLLVCLEWYGDTRPVENSVG